ncbi:MAG: hypothetical protein WBY94_03040 [Polyangiaceae bacterium]
MQRRADPDEMQAAPAALVDEADPQAHLRSEAAYRRGAALDARRTSLPIVEASVKVR